MGNAFLYGNGGGTELAIKIIGGMQRPETGKQGTIWINTDQKITGWTIQGEEPISPTEGMVWINNITYASLNALKKNGIWFTPISAKQYTSGTWVKKIGEYYNNNQWIAFFEATIHVTYPTGSICTATDGTTTLTAPDTSGTWKCVVPNVGTWTVSTSNGFQEIVEVSSNGEELTLNKWYLFKNGDTHDSITGGWDITYGRGSGMIDYFISLKTQGPSGSTYGTCALSTKKQINLTGCKKLCFQIVCTNTTGTASTTYRHFGYKADGKIVFSSGSTISDLTAYAVAAVDDTEVYVPVSDISGYVGVAIKTNQGKGTTTKISAIWIEG